MARDVDEELERLLRNWAAWRMGAERGGGIPPSPAYSLVPPSPRYESRVPVLSGDAEEVDRIVVGPPGLDVKLREVLEVHYMQAEQPIRARVAACGCANETYYNRLEQARALVRAALNQRARAVGLRARGGVGWRPMVPAGCG